jgi:hypothetical protein
LNVAPFDPPPNCSPTVMFRPSGGRCYETWRNVDTSNNQTQYHRPYTGCLFRTVAVVVCVCDVRRHALSFGEQTVHPSYRQSAELVRF